LKRSRRDPASLKNYAEVNAVAGVSIIEQIPQRVVLACGEVEGFEDFGLGIRG